MNQQLVNLLGLPHYFTWELLCAYVLAGLVGGMLGFCALCLERGEGIQLPRVYRRQDAQGQWRSYFDPGFLASVLIAVVGAVYIDGRWWTAAIYGAAICFMGPIFVRRFLQRLASEAGAEISFSAPSAPAMSAQLENK